MVKLGLVTGSVIPRPLARPRVKVVLPVPTSPMSSMTAAEFCEDLNFLAKFLPNASMSFSEAIFIV